MSRTPRILLDARGTQEGYKGHKHRGTGYYAQHLLTEISRRPGEFEPWFLFDERLPIDFDVPKDRRVFHRPLRVPRALTIPEAQVTLPSAIARAGVDLVHFLAHEDGCISSSTPMVVTVLDTIPITLSHLYSRLQRFKRLPVHAIGTRIVRHAKEIIAISERTREDVVSVYGVPRERITVTHLAADEHFASIPSPSKVRAFLRSRKLPKHYVLYVGGIDPRKNVPRLLEAFAFLVRNGFPDLVLVHAGSLRSQVEYPSYMQTIARLGLERNVIQTGFVDDADLPLLYAGSLVYLFPSMFEGFGLPVLQAMSVGAPVVTTYGGSIPEVGGDAVAYVDPMDAMDIARAVREVMTNRRLAERLRTTGMRRSRQFTWARTARETMNVYRSVLESGTQKVATHNRHKPDPRRRHG